MSETHRKRYGSTELAEFKEIILQKLDAANENLELLQDQVREVNDNHDDEAGGDWFDAASISAEIDLLTSMVTRQRKYIQDLEHALVRIKTESYGICVLTGELISKERLRLVPHATKSVAAKNMSDQPQKRQSVPEVKVTKPRIITKKLQKSSTSTVDKAAITESSQDKKSYSTDSDPDLNDWLLDTSPTDEAFPGS